MKRWNAPLVIGSLCALAWLTAGPAHAQIKLPIYDPDEAPTPIKNVTYEPATERADYRHGTLMRVTLKSGKEVKGILVRADPKADKLYIREKPGMAPTAVNINDIKVEGDRPRVEKGLVTVTKTKVGADGKIVPVETVRERVVQPEISAVMIQEGPVKYGAYNSNVLTAQEASTLVELQAAEREVAQLEIQSLLRTLNLAAADAMLHERLRTQQLLNQALAQQINAMIEPYPMIGLGFGTGRFGGIPYFPGAGLGLGGLDAYTAIAASQVASTVPVPSRPLPETIADSLGKARERLRVVQSKAIYEDGRIVAVVYEEKPK